MRNAGGRPHWIGACLALACLGAPHLAQASGALPPVERTERFRSHAQCVEAIERHAAVDRERVRPKTTAPDGATSETELATEGVKRIDRRTVRYEAWIWSHSGAPRPNNTIENYHTYERFIRECHGRVLNTVESEGYTSSTFDPAGEAR